MLLEARSREFCSPPSGEDRGRPSIASPLLCQTHPWTRPHLPLGIQVGVQILHSKGAPSAPCYNPLYTGPRPLSCAGPQPSRGAVQPACSQKCCPNKPEHTGDLVVKHRCREAFSDARSEKAANLLPLSCLAEAKPRPGRYLFRRGSIPRPSSVLSISHTSPADVAASVLCKPRLHFSEKLESSRH